jgi:hypothetical protein
VVVFAPRGFTNKPELNTRDGYTAVVDLDTGAVRQLTSAVPVGDGFAAAARSSVVRVAPDGKVSPVAATSGVPFQLTPDAEGNVVFLDLAGQTSRVRRTGAVASGRSAPAATPAAGPAGQVRVRSGAAGRVYVTGKASCEVGPVDESGDSPLFDPSEAWDISTMTS